MYNLKKYTQKDRYGNTITFEVERMQEPTVPSMQDIPQPDHPGGPKGTDTVPAWLTPGEFVMNAEATRMYEPQIKAMNDHGRAIQKAQGGTIPEYHADGGKTKADTSWVTEELLDGLKFSESSNRHYDKDGNLLRSGAGAVGAYQFIPKYATKGMGYGVAPFDVTSEKAQRQAAGDYLRGMQKHYPDWDPTDVLRAYNWGPKNVADLKEGWLTQYDMPEEARNYPGKVITNAVKKPWINRAEGSEKPEVPVMFEQPVPPNSEYVPVLDSGLYAMDPTNDAYPAEYEMDNYLYNASDEAYNAAMERGLDQASTQVDMLNAPEELQKQLDINAQERERQSSVPYDEFSDIPNNGGVEPLTADDQKKVEEGRVRREQDYAAQLADKLDRGESLTETEKTTLAELERSRKQVMPEPTYIDRDAEGEDMNITYDMEAVRSFADKYGEPDDAKFDKMDKEFANLPSSKDESSFLDNFISKDMQASIGGFFSKMMGHALSDRALSALVMNYVGSRAMGYDHGSSFQFAAKKYGKQIEAGQALEDKLYLSGKYKAPSIKNAMEKGDFGELVLAKSGTTMTSTFEDFYRGGKKYRARKYKIGDNEVWYAKDPQTGQTIPIDESFSSDARYTPGTKEYDARMSDARKGIESSFQEVIDAVGLDDDDKPIFGAGKTKLTDEYMNWLRDSGLEPDTKQARDVAGNALRQYYLAVKDGRVKPGATSIRGFLDDQMIRENTGTQELFMINREDFESGDDQVPVYVSPLKMKTLYQKMDALAREMPEGTKATKQALFAHAIKKWGEHAKNNTKLYQKYMESSTEKSTPFYNFLEAEFEVAMKDFAAK